MGGGDTCQRKAKSSTASQSSSTSLGACVHHSKRSKGSAAPTRSSSTLKLKNTDIDDLPDVVLVHILHRLPSFDFVFKCRAVCKRWSILMSDPYFISRFLLRLRSQHAPIPLRTLINRKGENFPVPLNPSSPVKFLTRMFLKLMSSLSLKKEPVVVGACNDLILCCASESSQRDYFICNPYTTQWVALPPVPRVLQNVPIGFICEAYYEYQREDINVNYRCMVVRILPYDDTDEDDYSYKFKAEIFSSEIGEWRESIISFPQKFTLNDINCTVSYAHKEMLYWPSTWGYYNFLIGLNPFMISQHMITSCNSSNSEHYYQCRYIELIGKGPCGDKRFDVQGVGVPGPGGCLQICLLNSHHCAFMWELKTEEDDHLTSAADGSRKLHAKHIPLHLAEEMELIGFNPNKQGSLYVRLDGSRFELINLHKRLSADFYMPETSRVISNYCFFPFIRNPWWPTPVPRLPYQLSA